MSAASATTASATLEAILAGGRRQRARRLAFLAGLAAATAAVAVQGLASGALGLALPAVFRALLGITSADGTIEPVAAHVVQSLRLPRVLTGLLVGATLAASGAALQGLLRNPLADPGLVGVSAGAALGAVAVIIFGPLFLHLVPEAIRPLSLPIAAFGAGLLTTFVVYRLANAGDGTNVALLLLAGIAVNAMVTAVIGYGIFVSNDQQLRDLQFWTLGSLAGVSWQGFTLPALMMLAAIAGLWRLGGALNGLALGESEAIHLGYDTETIKRVLILLVALGVGSTVAIAGTIAFVGLVVPHLARLLVGLDHRYVMPASALLGGALLVLADTAARLVVLPAELPLGIITSIIGGPFFLALLLWHRRRIVL